MAKADLRRLFEGKTPRLIDSPSLQTPMTAVSAFAFPTVELCFHSLVGPGLEREGVKSDLAVNQGAADSMREPAPASPHPQTPVLTQKPAEVAPTPGCNAFDLKELIRSSVVPRATRASHGAIGVTVTKDDHVLITLSAPPCPKGKSKGTPSLTFRLQEPPSGVARGSEEGVRHYRSTLAELAIQLRHSESVFSGNALNPYSHFLAKLREHTLLRASHVTWNGLDFPIRTKDLVLEECSRGNLVRSLIQIALNSSSISKVPGWRAALRKARVLRGEQSEEEKIGLRDRLRQSLYRVAFHTRPFWGPSRLFGEPLLGGLLKLERTR
jgi:hypothetical protein